MTATKSLLLASLCLCAGNAFAQSADDEPLAIVELGGATSWSLKDGGSSFGSDIAVEVTPIENWLELEAGTTPLFTRHSTEWDTDLLFKKPWTLSKKVEFMFGVGPEWIHTREYGVTTNSFGRIGTPLQGGTVVVASAAFIARIAARRGNRSKIVIVKNPTRRIPQAPFAFIDQ